jgi:hypothetical protein
MTKQIYNKDIEKGCRIKKVLYDQVDLFNWSLITLVMMMIVINFIIVNFFDIINKNKN